MKIIRILFLLLICACSASALPPKLSEAYKNFFSWNAGRKLQWSDFKGKAVPNANESAMTASSVEFSYATNGRQIMWEVMAKFYPDISWSKQADQSDYILQHEQGHFDITELYARLFRKQLSEQVKTAADVPKMQSIGKLILKDWDKEENRYDQETRHSLDKEKQAEWLKNLQERMDALKDFASK